MDQSKFFQIDLNGVPVANMPVYPVNTIGQLKDHLNGMYPNTQIIIIINNGIINDNSLVLGHYWDKIVVGVIQVNNIVPIPKPIPVVGVPQIRIRNVERGVSYPNVTGFKNIPAWSRGAKPWKELSPFTIGPVIFEENGNMKQANIFENFYQGFKVWEKVDKQNTKNWKWPAETHVDTNGNPNAYWYRWHDTLLQHNLPVRRPNGKNIPLYSWWKGQKLGVVDSRKNIYIPYLQHLYRNHPTYQKLLADVKKGQKIIILEPDGPHHSLYPDGMPVNLDMLYRLQDVTKMKDFPGGERYGNPGKYVAYGHGYVIALTLLEDMK